jgi:site-specific DNA-methyltransferase (adenine-specific)
VIIASKLRLDRALDRKMRAQRGMPHENTISKEEFHEATLDTWRIRPESAKRVGHPAPFPVELPRRLIELYSYRDDLILDPFIGAGTTAVAALRSRRRYVGYDTDSTYISLAESRVAVEVEEMRGRG